MAAKYPRKVTRQVTRVVKSEVLLYWEHKCPECSEVFRAKTRGARYCSARCRKRASRSRKR